MMENRRTVIIGATTNTSRYAYLAASMLNDYKYDFIPVGIKKGIVFGKEILDIRTLPVVKDVDTVTIYINPDKQAEWYNYILGLHPRRVIFNPGTENDEFEKVLSASGTEPVEACTLVMLRSGQF